MLRRTIDAFNLFHNSVGVAGAEFLQDKNIIFEGAQGLALDMDGPNFPHVTRSNTGLTNVLPLAKLLDLELDVIYVTRTYLTKHGAGPLPKEFTPDPPIHDETNMPHDYQGVLRFAELDVVDLALRITTDMDLAPKRINASLAITWLNSPYNKLSHGDMFMPVRFTSDGPTRSDITEY